MFSQSYLEDFTSGKFKPNTPPNIYHLSDGERFACLSENNKTIKVYHYNSEKSEEIFNIDKIKNCPVKEIANFEFDNQEQKILVHTDKKMIYRRSFTTDYYVYDIKRNKIEQLSENGSQQMAHFSPNGRIVAFARDNNLYLKKLDFDTESQITKDGEKNKIINGTPDWVYEEEFTNICYFEWSPDSKLLAFIRFDEREVNKFSFQWINDTYPTLQTYKYAKAGTPNSKVSVWIYDVENRTTTKMQLPENEDFYIPTMKWTLNNGALAVVKLSRSQKQIDLLSFNPRSGISTKLYSENAKTYSDYRNFDVVQFLSDNSFILMSEKDNFRHLYLFEPNGIVKQQLTKGNWDITAFYGYDEKIKTAYFQAANFSPIQRNVCSVGSNGKISVFDERKGYQKANFSTNFKYAVYSFDNSTTPTIFTIINEKGKTIRNFGGNKDLSEKFKSLNLPQKEFLKITTTLGIELNAWIVKPTDFKSNKKYPLVMVQYGGPDSQEVLNRWHLDWEYYLAQQGFIVACADGRGTGARGRQFRDCTYGKLGELEAQDQIGAANYFAQMPEVDKDRMAIWGWSYGGFMTLMCMTSPDNPFKAGIAIAPVTDWKLYNTAYTERFMNRPQENYSGYAETNILERVNNLTGNMLLIHGTADDNVLTQNSYLLAEKLVEAGKQFDMQLYTNKNHSILGDKARLHLYRRCTIFLMEHFK